MRHPHLNVKRGFGKGFPSWLKLFHMVQQASSTLVAKYCAYVFNSSKLTDLQKLIRSSEVGPRADTHLSLPVSPQ